MEFLSHTPSWIYTMIFAIVMAGFIVLAGDRFEIPRPRKKNDKETGR